MPEPTLIEQPRVAAEAIFGREAPPVGPITPEQEMAGIIRRELAKDMSSRQIMEGLAPHPSPTEARIKQVNNENIGTKRKGGSGEDAGDKEYVAGSTAEQLRARADKNASLAQELLSKKYDEIDDTAVFHTEGGTNYTKKGYLVKNLTDAAMAWPEAKAVLEGLSDDDRRLKIEEIFLRNPQFLKKLGARFGEIYDGEKSVFVDSVSESQDEFSAWEKKYALKKKEVDEANKEKRANSLVLKQYRPGGGEYTSHTARKSNQATCETTVALKGRELDKARRKIDELQKQRYYNVKNPATGAIERQENPAISGQISDIENNEIATLQGDLDNAVAELGKIKSFEETLAKLETKDTELSENISKLETDFADLDLEHSKARRKLDVARAARSADEERFVNEIEGMFRESGMRFMKAEVGRYEAAQAKIANEAIAKATTDDEKHIQRAMKNKWRKDEKHGRRTVSKVNTNEVRGAYDQLIREGNADWLVKQFMQQGLIDVRTKYGVGSVQEQEEQRRLDERFKDTNYMEKMGAVVAQRLFESYIESGGKFRKEDATLLTQTKWGEAAINGAFAQNEKADEMIEDLRRRTAPSSTKAEFIGNLLKNPKTYGVGAGLLALIFGAPFLIAGAGVAASAYSSAVGAVS